MYEALIRQVDSADSAEIKPDDVERSPITKRGLRPPPLPLPRGPLGSEVDVTSPLNHASRGTLHSTYMHQLQTRLADLNQEVAACSPNGGDSARLTELRDHVAVLLREEMAVRSAVAVDGNGSAGGGREGLVSPVSQSWVAPPPYEQG
jgi:hypothetical protein